MGSAVKAKAELVQVEAVEERTDVTSTSAKAEWVALMCCIAEHDRDLYRELREEAWESVECSGVRSKDSN